MISLFEQSNDSLKGTIFPSNWESIKTGLQINIEKIQNYYRTFPVPVTSNHFLVQLLLSLDIDAETSIRNCFNIVDSRSMNLSMTLEMTSPRYKGKLFSNVFYGEKSNECLIALDDWFDLELVSKDWKNISAVKPIIHNCRDRQITIPGSKYCNDSEFTVTGINISLLAIQYRMFMVEEEKDSNIHAATWFIGKYVLPNTLKEYMDIALFNMLEACYRHGKNSVLNTIRTQVHPFSLPDYTQYLPNALEKVIENLSLTDKSFEAILENIPSVFKKNMFKSLIMPDIAPTSHIDWALICSRLRVINFLIDIAGDVSYSKNSEAVKQILRSFHINNAGNVMSQILPNEILNEMNSYRNRMLGFVNNDPLELKN